MLRHHAIVFDDYITPNVPAYTGVQHAQMLATGDQLGLQAILALDAGGGAFTAAIEHSTDGVNWQQKNAGLFTILTDPRPDPPGSGHPAPI